MVVIAVLLMLCIGIVWWQDKRTERIFKANSTQGMFHDKAESEKRITSTKEEAIVAAEFDGGAAAK